MTAVDAVLLAMLVAVSVMYVVAERAHRKERRRLTHAVIAKHGSELFALERERREPTPHPEREKAAMLDNPLGL